MAETEWVNNLRAQVPSPSKLTLTWSLDGTWDDLEQRIWCRNSGSESGEWAYVYDVSPEAKSFTWTDCSPGQSYDFCVGARNAGGSWYYGYLYGVPMDAILSAGTADVDPASGDVEVVWERNPNASLGRAELWYRDEALRNQGAWYDDVPTTTSESYTFGGLPGGRFYDFWVRQRYSESGYTDRQLEWVWLPGLANLRWEYAEDRTAVRLTWEANGYLKGISGSGTAATSPTEGAWATVYWEDRAKPGQWRTVDSWIPATQEEYTVSDLEPGHAYRFCARIRDFGYPVWREGMWDNDLYTPYVDMPHLTTPRAVSALRAEYSRATGKVELSWTNNERNAGDSMQPYAETRVYRQTDGAGAWELLSFGSVEESYSDEVARGHSYQYKVVPANAAGSGPEVKSAVVKVAAQLAPRAPSGVSAALDRDTRRVTVSWSQQDGWERPVQETRVYRQADGSGPYEELGTADGSPYIDQAPTGGHSYRYRVQSRNDAGWGGAAESNSVAVPPEAPLAPTSCEVAADGLTATVSWESQAEDGRPYSTVTVERSDNGGAWARCAVLGGSAESFAETLPENGFYRYRVYATNDAGSSAPSEPSGIAYTRPSAPSKPSAARTAQGCSVSWRPAARVCDASQVEPSWYDASLYEWVPMAVIDAPAGAVSAADAAPQSDAPMSYRVRSGVRTGEGEWLWSEWSDRSDAVAPGQAPDAPTIAAPRAGETVELSEPGGVPASWRHNPLDGSLQSAWEARLSFGGQVRGSASGTGPGMSCPDVLAACGVDVLSLAAELGPSVHTGDWELSVRTAGAVTGAWSPWSSSRFRIARRPRVWFEEPGADAFEGGAAVLSEFPPTVTVGFDGHGYGAAAGLPMELTAADASGEVVGRASLPFEGESASVELGPSFWSPEADGSYTLRAVVHASSGIDGSAEVPVRTSFPRPKFSSLRIDCDPERGWVELTPHVNANDAGGRPVERMDVWRVVGGGEPVLVAEGLSEGQSATDRFAPVNREVCYRLGAYSDQGVYMVEDHRGVVASMYTYLYYGEGFEKVARGTFNMADDATLSRSRQTLVEYAGRPYPVLYDGGGMSETRSAQFTVEGEGEWGPFREAAACAEVYVKDVGGEAFRACAEITVGIPDGLPSAFRTVSVEATRVDGDAL